MTFEPYTWKTRPIEYDKRPDGLWNRWELLARVNFDSRIQEDIYHFGDSANPLIWVITDVVEEKA